MKFAYKYSFVSEPLTRTKRATARPRGSVELRPIATKHLEAWANGQERPKWSDQGFGLWLSRKLVEKIGGEVGVKDGGGTFNNKEYPRR